MHARVCSNGCVTLRAWPAIKASKQRLLVSCRGCHSVSTFSMGEGEEYEF
jgi:hypothetical protein